MTEIAVNIKQIEMVSSVEESVPSEFAVEIFSETSDDSATAVAVSTESTNKTVKKTKRNFFII